MASPVLPAYQPRPWYSDTSTLAQRRRALKRWTGSGDKVALTVHDARIRHAWRMHDEGRTYREIVLSGTDGLLTGTVLANHNVNAVTMFANYLAEFGYSHVDGKYAGTTADLRIVVGAATYAHMGAAYRNNNVDRNAIDRLMEITGGVKVSGHVPAVSGNKQNGLIRLGMRRDMVAPVWEGITLIPDEVTKAANGQIVITAVMLYAVKVLRAAGFYKQQTQHA